MYTDCINYRAEEVRSHPFFLGVDWQQVYMQKYPPPLVPPRGEVNAADAFDIGSFDEEDTKGYKVLLASNNPTARFISIVVSLKTESFHPYILGLAVDREGSGTLP